MNPLYIRIRDGKHARTVEGRAGLTFGDYDAKGRLIGVESLASVEQLAEWFGLPARLIGKVGSANYGA